MKANMVYYNIHLFQSNTFVYHCVINQTLQNGQTLGQFFEPLYIICPILIKSQHISQLCHRLHIWHKWASHNKPQ